MGELDQVEDEGGKMPNNDLAKGAEEEAVESHHIPSPPALLFGHTPQSSHLPACPQHAVHPLVLGCGGIETSMLT